MQWADVVEDPNLTDGEASAPILAPSFPVNIEV